MIPKDLRRYRCNDPACTGYPKGHRHGLTCHPRTPTAFHSGMVLGCLHMLLQRVKQAQAVAMRSGYHQLADDLEADRLSVVRKIDNFTRSTE